MGLTLSFPIALSLAPQPPTPSRTPAASPLTIEPLYVRLLPESSQLRAAMVSPDGNSIYSLVEVPVVDIGKVLNQHALAWTGALTGILTSLLAVWVWRAARRRRRPGSLYCRRCDYDVTSLAIGAATRCPECGADLASKPPVAGRGGARRTALPLCLLLVVLAAYALVGFSWHKGHRELIPEGRWGSQTLESWSGHGSLAWLKEAAATGDLLLEVDAATGQTRRRVTTRATQTYWQMEFNPGAQAVYLSNRSQGADLVDLSSGRVRASFNQRPLDINASSAPSIIGHSANFDVVYLNTTESPRSGRAILTEWNWRTGATRDIASEVGYRRTDSPLPFGRHYAMVPGQPRRFVLYPDFMEAFNAKMFNVKVLDGDGNTRVEKDLGPRVAHDAVPAFSTDGELMFLVRGYGDAIEGYSTGSLERVGSADSAERGSSASRVIVRADGRLMIVPGIQNMDVRDLVEKKWIARLKHPSDSYAPRSITFSDDGRTVGAVFQSGGSGGGGGPFVFKLGVWRLPESLGANAQTPQAK